MPALQEWFSQADQEQRDHLARLWGLEPEALEGQKQQTEHAIRSQMCLPFAARGVWLHLSDAARQCLYAILTAPPKKGLQRAQLGKKIRLPYMEVEHALEELQAIALIFPRLLPLPTPLHGPRPRPEEATEVWLPTPECAEALAQTGRELFTPGGDRSTWELRHLLDQLPWETVERLARLCAVPLQTYERWQPVAVSSREVRDQVRERFETSPAVFALLRRLEPGAEHLWAWLWDQGRRAPPERAQSALGVTMNELGRLVSQLEAHALLFDTLTPQGERLLFFPLTISERLQPDVTRWLVEEQVHTWEPLDTPPAHTRSGPPTLLYDLAGLVGWVYQTTVEPTKEGQLPKRMSAHLRARLQGLPRRDELGQDAYPDRLVQAALDLRLLQRVTPYEGAKARYVPGPALAVWGQASEEEQIRRFLTWWQASHEWQDLLPDQRALSAYHWTPQHRTQVLQQLRRSSAGQWYATSALLYALWKEAPLDLTERSRVSTGPFALLQTQRERWQAREGQRMLGMLTSTLADLGLVGLGWDKATEAAAPVAVRLTPLGAEVLGLAPVSADHMAPALVSSPLIVQPSFELVLRQTELPLLYQLLPWAELTHLSLAATLRLTQRSLTQGLLHGGDLDQLLALLKSASGRALPQNVDYSLREWARKHKGVRLAPVFLLTVPSREVALEVRQVLADHHIAAQPVSPHLLAVESNLTSLGVIHRHLEQAGIPVQRGMPVMEKQEHGSKPSR